MFHTIAQLGVRHARLLLITVLLLAGLVAVQLSHAQAQTKPKPQPVKLGLVIHSADPETVWNVFRLGVFALQKGDTVKVFLLAKGVECESLDNDKFKVTEMMKSYVAKGGKIFACGTCLKTRQSEGTDLCPISTMADLYDIIRESDRVVTF